MPTDVTVIVATCGNLEWAQRAAAAAKSAWDADDLIVAHYRDLTVPQARNEAARSARCDWLCFLDADDLLAPGYLVEMRRAAAAAGGPALLFPSVQYRTAVGVGVAHVPNRGRWPKLNEMVIGTLVPAWLFEDVGGFRDLPSLEDYDLWLRCCDAGAARVYVSHAVYVATGSGRNDDQSVYHEIWAQRDRDGRMYGLA